MNPPFKFVQVKVSLVSSAVGSMKTTRHVHDGAAIFVTLRTRSGALFDVFLFFFIFLDSLRKNLDEFLGFVAGKGEIKNFFISSVLAVTPQLQSQLFRSPPGDIKGVYLFEIVHLGRT